MLTQGIITEESKKEAIIICRDIDLLRDAEQMYQRQRAFMQWNLKGDKCTRYFHVVASTRKKANTILEIEDSEGRPVVGQEMVHNVAIQFYENLFISQGRADFELSGVFPRRLFDSISGALTLPYLEEEVKHGIMSMEGGKSPGPDGLSASFYKTY